MTREKLAGMAPINNFDWCWIIVLGHDDVATGSTIERLINSRESIRVYVNQEPIGQREVPSPFRHKVQNRNMVDLLCPSPLPELFHSIRLHFDGFKVDIGQ